MRMFSFSRIRVAVAISGLIFALVRPSQAQQFQPSLSGPAVDNFYQRGDEMSERVSGFMRRIFGGGQQRSAYGNAPQQYSQPQPQYSAQQQYSQPPAPQTNSSGGSFFSRFSRPKTVAPAPTYSQAPTTVPTTGVYGYQTESSTPSRSVSGTPSYRQSPTQPATRSNPVKPKRKPIFGSDKTTEPKPEAVKNETYVPPTLPQSTPPEPPKNEAINSFKMDGLEPGTVVNPTPEKKSIFGSGASKTQTQSPPPNTESKSLNDIVTTQPKPSPNPANSNSTTIPTYREEDILVGNKGSMPGRVISPHAPYNELDVTGLESGSVAMDPTTQKVFLVP